MVDQKRFPDAPILEDRLSRNFLKESSIIPLEESPECLSIAMIDPFDVGAIGVVQFAVGKDLSIFVACPSDFETAWDRLYGEGKSEIDQIADDAQDHPDDFASDDVERLKDIASEAPVIRLVNLLITRAVEARASDIHIEPMDGELRVHRRIDGVPRDFEFLSQHQSLANNILK